jgi:hypothetical protein
MDSIAIVMFWVSSVLIFPFWFLMWFMPEHQLTKRFVGDVRWCVAPLLLSYTILALPNAAEVLMTTLTRSGPLCRALCLATDAFRAKADVCINADTHHVYDDGSSWLLVGAFSDME